ncbi:MAG: FtsX-like permease family protein [Planctomycetota bacterium]|nr:FtsX-like permease family protein [Planctomycetota bacterium]
MITRELAAELFPCQNPLDKTLYLSDRAATHAFTVIGVLDQLPQSLARQAGTGARCAIIPLTTDLATFGEVMVFAAQGSRDAERVEVSQCILRMADEQAVLAAAPIVRDLLERFHPGVRDYEVRVPVEEIELMKADRRRWNFMFVMIASVSLLVGGIGIMNIMLASVTERTREIGIRRALGAKRRHIVTQFLVESVTLTTIGGVLGIAIGLLVPWIIRRALGFETLTTAATLLVPFVMAVVVGLLSGLYPALRAARLDPVEALRHE